MQDAEKEENADMSKISQLMERLKLVPVVKIDNASDAAHLAGALMDGGLPLAEITFRTAAAIDSMKTIKKEFPDMTIGAGSVTTVAQIDAAVEAGAAFIVSAGYSRKLVSHCKEIGIEVFPGICTPTEIMMLLEDGLNIAKFFPANIMGGMAGLKALGAPFPGLRFMPTGGIKPENLMDYLALSSVIACGGSWMVNDKLISAHQFDQIAKLTSEAVRMIKNAGF